MITLKTLPQATAQEVFDQITQHLLRQGKAARSGTGACRYRVELKGEVLKCAAGCLIADDEYDSKWEGIDWKHLAAQGLLPSRHFNLIHAFQEIHDTVAVDHWQDSFKSLAVRFNLQLS